MAYVLGERAARKFREMMRGETASGSSAGAVHPSFEPAFPPPWECRWADSADNGDGSWIIWLPSGSLVYAGADVTALLVSSLTPVGGDYPAGWYLLDCVPETGGTPYLVVPEADANPWQPEISESGSAQSDATMIEIATLANTQAAGVVVKQKVVGTLVLESVESDSDSGVVPDKISIDWNESGELEIKGWESGEPELEHTIAEVLSGKAGSIDKDEMLIVRRTDGTLAYRKVGEIEPESDSGSEGGAGFWVTGGDETTCNANRIQVGSVLIYEETL